MLLRAGRVRRLPPNVHALDRVPLDRALRHATAFVHHGGSGGLLQALAAGVPQLVTPGIADRRHNATVLARTGAGIGAETRHVTAAVLGRLVHDPALRSAAEEWRHRIDALPAPSTALPLLVHEG
ncbi:glycosyltransferase [Pseudonocardia sp. HH130630-07]|uniref:glycosyltransferase n=1 Tax=Pseudonocardia sp. HH130630-07 TaxID=1690815 RepID=UPI0008151DBD|nr:nucleotide disphospho-sugar-binding domain-containing protein [Pseudonocardia sp. HH130630-07]ANY08493.1 hypothetical protein AFB00_21970 [Pseudonocardia sp. HH130630-07]